jgi:mannose-6-phosphate isomerase-like protein (cupin superfamily)
MDNFHSTILRASEQLAKESSAPFTIMMQHGTMQVEYFAPKGTDTQQPHQQDELYCIASGSAVFNRNGEKANVSTGDFLFVPAHMHHRFEDFSDDFATWVIFYGVVGGETNPSV